MNRLESKMIKYENSYLNDPKQNKHTSYMFNEVLIYFRNECAFGNILAANAKNHKFDSQTQGKDYLEWILTVSDLYDDEFIQENLPKIKEARNNAISMICEDGIDITCRIFTYDMISTLDQLIHRLYPEEGTNIEDEKLYLKVLSCHTGIDAAELPEEFWNEYFEYLDVS